MGEYTGTTVYRGGPDYHPIHSADYHIHDTSNAGALTFLFVLVFIIVVGMVFATHPNYFEGDSPEKPKTCHKHKPHTHEHTHRWHRGESQESGQAPQNDAKAITGKGGGQARSKAANLFMV